MEHKNFLLDLKYKAVIDKMSEKQVGTLFKAVFEYAATKGVKEGFKDVQVETAFDFIKQDLDENEKRWNKTLELRSEAGKKGGAPKGNNNAVKQAKQAKQAFACLGKNENNLKQPKTTSAQKTSKQANGCFVKHNENSSNFECAKTTKQAKQADCVVDCVSVTTNYLPEASAPDAQLAEKEKKVRELNALQKFSNSVMLNFEPDSKEWDSPQKGIWFKRNARCLSDILVFCKKNERLAIETIRQCCKAMDKMGVENYGYEAVVRKQTLYCT